MCEGEEDLGEWLFGWIIALAKVVLGKSRAVEWKLMLGLNNTVEGWSLLTQIMHKVAESICACAEACVCVYVFIVHDKGRLVRK